MNRKTKRLIERGETAKVYQDLVDILMIEDIGDCEIKVGNGICATSVKTRNYVLQDEIEDRVSLIIGNKKYVIPYKNKDLKKVLFTFFDSQLDLLVNNE